MFDQTHGTIIRVANLRVDLRTGDALWTPEDVLLYQGDKAANALRIVLINGAVPVDARGYRALLTVLRPDGNLVVCGCDAVVGQGLSQQGLALPEGAATCGAAVLSTTLPAACYELAGTLGCVLRLTDSRGTATAISFSLTVRTSADAAALGIASSDVLDISGLLELRAKLETLQSTGLSLQGAVDSPQALEDRVGEEGQAYLVGDTLYVWTGDAWMPGPYLNAKDGASAYDLAVGVGFSGTLEQWLASLKGTDGLDGANGLDGQGISAGDIFDALRTQDKTILGAINELYGTLDGVGDLLAQVLGEEDAQ